MELIRERIIYVFNTESTEVSEFHRVVYSVKLYSSLWTLCLLYPV